MYVSCLCSYHTHNPKQTGIKRINECIECVCGTVCEHSQNKEEKEKNALAKAKEATDRGVKEKRLNICLANIVWWPVVVVDSKRFSVREKAKTIRTQNVDNVSVVCVCVHAAQHRHRLDYIGLGSFSTKQFQRTDGLKC